MVVRVARLLIECLHLRLKPAYAAPAPAAPPTLADMPFLRYYCFFFSTQRYDQGGIPEIAQFVRME